MKKHQRGFSLIELMVAVSLFSIIMLVSVGALLALVNANRKARALESVMNNLNIAIDGMVRAIRMGNTFNCGGTDIPVYPENGDCAVGGGTIFSFAPFGSLPSDPNERWVYSFEEDEDGTGRIYRSRDGGPGAIAVTAPEVDIEDMTFYTVGTIRGNSPDQDTTQPKVVIVIKGTAGVEELRTSSTFYIQATAVQRVLDL